MIKVCKYPLIRPSNLIALLFQILVFDPVFLVHQKCNMNNKAQQTLIWNKDIKVSNLTNSALVIVHNKIL